MEAKYLSVDPYMRTLNSYFPLGSTMVGFMVGEIIESKNPRWPVGKNLVGDFGWVTHTVINPDKYERFPEKPYPLPELGDLPISLGLGMLGLPG